MTVPILANKYRLLVPWCSHLTSICTYQRSVYVLFCQRKVEIHQKLAKIALHWSQQNLLLSFLNTKYCVDIGEISSFTQCSSKQRGFKIANLKVCYGILEKINLRLFSFISHCLWAFEKAKWKLKVRRFFIRINTFYEMWWMHPHMFSVWRRKCRQRRNAIVNIRMHIKTYLSTMEFGTIILLCFCVCVWLDCRLLLW